MLSSKAEEYLNQLVAEDALEEIKLGLDRIAEVYAKLDLSNRPFTYIVGGTNGKGSCCALLERGLRCQGYTTGLICSPHLLSFNERVCINGLAASDAEWLAALKHIKSIKGETPLTYFEYCTLAAFVIFAKHEVDVWVLEVGLGGRLDAVNILDADCAVLTSIGLDHTEILGDTREKIAYEKIAIARTNKHLVVGEADLPDNFMQLAEESGANMLLINRDFSYAAGEGDDKDKDILAQQLLAAGDSFYAQDISGEALTITIPEYNQPMLASNLATAWQALSLYKSAPNMSPGTSEKTNLVAAAWQKFTLPGRWQKFSIGRDTLIMDSGHNPAAAEVLSRMLQKELQDCNTAPKITAVFSMLGNKDWQGFIQPLAPLVDTWHIFPLETDKGLPLNEMRQRITDLAILDEDKVIPHKSSADLVNELFVHGSDDNDASIFFVCGSFHTVGEIMTHLKSAGIIDAK